MIFIIAYIFVGSIVYYRGRKKGGWVTGLIVAGLWFILPIIWCLGWLCEKYE